LGGDFFVGGGSRFLKLEESRCLDKWGLTPRERKGLFRLGVYEKMSGNDSSEVLDEDVARKISKVAKRTWGWWGEQL